MNILLVQAYLGRTEPPVFPLGLSCLVSSIKGHNLKVFDPNVSKDPYVELANTLDRFRPDIVGISIRNIDSTNKRKVVFYYKYLRDMIDVVKSNIYSPSKIIVGGSGFSMFANEIMHDESRVDYGVFLEGEQTFPELIENLEQPEIVKGIFYRRDGEAIFTGPRDQVDLNSVPFPDRTVISLEPYKGTRDSIGVETKRGCMLDCIYCVYGFLNGKRLRLRNPGMVVDEIETLVRDMGVKRFTFVDAVFNIPLSHAEVICKEMIKRNLDVSWSAWFHEKYMTEEFVQLVKEAGCNKIILSPDGFSDKVLFILGKNLRKKDILRTFDIIKKVDDGIEVCYNFFKNPPGQDLITFLKLLYFYFRAKFLLKERVHFEFNSIRIEPHTRLYKIALEEGLIKKNDGILYPKYYTNPDTVYIEKIFDMMLRLKGK